MTSFARVCLMATLALAVICAFVLAGSEAQAAPFTLPMFVDTTAIIEVARPLAVKDDPIDLEQFAWEVARVSNGNADWQALLITIAAHESNFSQRIADGQCKPWECDPTHKRGKLIFQAWSLYQQHKNLNNLHEFGSTDIGVQVESGYRALRRAYWTCARLSSKNPPTAVWVAFTINAYSGRRCDASWDGLNARLATFSKIRSRL